MDQFQQIIDKYGPSFMSNIAAPVWEAAVKQTWVDGIMDALWAIVMLVLAFASFRLSRWSAKKYDDSSDKYGDKALFFIIVAWVAAVFVPVAVVWSFVDVDSAVHRILNPTWYAVENLGSLVKK